MQAEEIIQQKEWPELNVEEKAFLAPLAADEQEYNLLKSMLLIAADEAVSVPALDPRLQQRISKELEGNPTVHFIRRWYYAAAAVILLTACIWLFLQPRDTGKQLVRETPAIDQQPVIDSLVPDTSPLIIPDTARSIPVLAGQTVKKTQQPHTAPAPATLPEGNDSLQHVYAVNTSVGQNIALLALVTEVYE